MFVEIIIALAVATATPQSLGSDIADLQRRIRALRDEAAQQQVSGAVVLQTPTDFHRTARRSLLDRLRDPGSAQFRAVRRVPASNGYVFCGEVNARNGFGGMTGYVRFQAYANADGRTYVELDDADQPLGRSYFQAGWARDCAGPGAAVQF